MFPNWSSDLDSLCYYFGINKSFREKYGHSALGDAQITATILERLCEAYLKKQENSISKKRKERGIFA